MHTFVPEIMSPIISIFPGGTEPAKPRQVGHQGAHAACKVLKHRSDYREAEMWKTDNRNPISAFSQPHPRTEKLREKKSHFGTSALS